MPRKPPPPGSLFYVLGQRLAERRVAAGLTQAELGAVIGNSGRAISQYELGLRQPSIDVLARICRAVDTPLSVLVSALDEHAPIEREEPWGKN